MQLFLLYGPLFLSQQPLNSHRKVMSFTEKYPRLHKLGLTHSALLASAIDSDNNIGTSNDLNISCITNETIIQLHQFMKSNTVCTFYNFWQWLARLLGKNWPKDNFPTVNAVRQSAIRLWEKYTRLN